MLRDSQISLLVVEGNVFQMKELQYIDGYEKVGYIVTVLASSKFLSFFTVISHLQKYEVFLFSTWKDTPPAS